MGMHHASVGSQFMRLRLVESSVVGAIDHSRPVALTFSERALPDGCHLEESRWKA
jgi:hypothetical protein